MASEWEDDGAGFGWIVAVTSRSKKDWPADKVERRPLDSLIPYARNARTHSDEQVAQIAASMREWGFTNAILCDEEGGIIAGHGRVLAARKLGFESVPVVVARGWSEAQKRAYVIADNQLALRAGWDMPMLAGELHSLNGEGFELGLLGFDVGEIDRLIGPLPDDGNYTGFLEDILGEKAEKTEAAESKIAAPEGWVTLSFAMEPDDRDTVIAYLGKKRDELGVDTAAQALIALAIKGV